MSSRSGSGVEVKGFQWKLRRQVGRLAAYFEQGTTRKYPKTSDAILQLRETVDAEMRTRRNRANPSETASLFVRGKSASWRRALRVSTTNGRSA